MRPTANARRAATIAAALGFAGLFPFLTRMGYRLPDVELVVIPLLSACSAGVLGLVAGNRPLVFHGLLFALILWVCDLYFFGSSWLAAATAALLVAAQHTRWRPNIEAQLLMFSVGFSLASLATNYRPLVNTDPLREQDEVLDASKPPIVHLILDEFVAPAALPPADALAGWDERIMREWTARGFRWFESTRAVSGWSPQSLASMVQVGRHDRGMPNPDLANHAVRHAVPSNEYFDRLLQRGWQVSVIGSDYLDFCISARSRCTRYPFGDHGHALARFPDRIGDRLYLAWRQVHLRAVLSPGTDGVGWYRALFLRTIDTNDHVQRSRTVAMLDVFDAAEAFAASAPIRGRALVVHVLLPHFPWILDAHCDLAPRAAWRGPRWAESGRDTGVAPGLYADSYWSQAICAHRRAIGLVDAVLARPDGRDARIVIHGDHGARLREQAISPSAADLSNDSPDEVLDTLFAARAPGIAQGNDPSRATLPQRFESVLTAITAEPEGQ